MKGSTKPKTAKKVVEKKEISIAKEEKLKLGHITEDGFTVKAILDDGRVLISDKNCAKVVNQSEVK